MIFTLVCFGVFLIMYIAVGIALATRVQTLGDCGKHEKPTSNEIWIIIFLWIVLGILKIWISGTEDI